MSSRHMDEGVCLDYLAGELAEEAKASFDRHLHGCAACRLRVEQYSQILQEGLPSIADELVGDVSVDSLPWSMKEGEKRLYTAVDNEDAVLVSGERRREFGARTLVWPGFPREWLRKKTLVQRALPAVAIAASVVGAFVLADSIYRLGVKHGKDQSHVAQAPPSDDGALRAQFESLMREKDAVQSRLALRGNLITQLRNQIEQQRKQNALLEENLLAANQQGQEQAQQISSQRDDLARRLEDQQAVVGAMQKKLDTIQQTGSTDAIRVVSLENRIQKMSQLLRDKDATIDERDRMLASDRDIRELMGARDLYMAEVYEVGGNGKKKKPTGRVFLAKGKFLIFYGYDFDQEPGLKSANTFQAWGMRGPNRNSALNLGVMFVDNAANKRWFLRCDDPKRLEEINAVFVTVEPDGQSRVPRGKEILFAYLGEAPNHP